MRRLVFVLLAACGGGDATVLYGNASIAVDVDPNSFASLELAGYVTNRVGEPPTSLEPVYRGSFPIAEIREWPYEFRVFGPLYPDGCYIYLRGWLSKVPGTPSAARGEPYGKAIVEIQENSQGPSSAGIDDFVIDSIIE